jgi:hypothetical protein
MSYNELLRYKVNIKKNREGFQQVHNCFYFELLASRQPQHPAHYFSAGFPTMVTEKEAIDWLRNGF